MDIKANNKNFTVLPGQNSSFWEQFENWEVDTFRIFDQFIDPEKSYIDLGAWIGPTILYGAQLAKLAYGIEPDPIAHAELQQNIAANPSLIDRIRISNVAIAPVSGEIDFGNQGAGGDSQSSLLFADGATQWKVAALTFDDFIRQHHVADCGFIKVD
jgi:FkbM family methyltransferase